MKAEITMRNILNSLVRELGTTEGRNIFEWYCSTYNVAVEDIAPVVVKREVLGI